MHLKGNESERPRHGDEDDLNPQTLHMYSEMSETMLLHHNLAKGGMNVRHERGGGE